MTALIAGMEIRFAPKDSSPLMRACAFVLRLFGQRSFLTSFWTTVGCTVYYPSLTCDPLAYPETVKHELVHVRQWQRLGVLGFLALYFLFPLPVGLAWGRWRLEREAYLVNARAGTSVDAIVETLWNAYGWPWPRSWMRRWFERELARGSETA